MGEVAAHGAKEGVFPRTEEVQKWLVEVCETDHAFEDFEFCFDFLLDVGCLGLVLSVLFCFGGG